jgi:hypothetical protein
MTIAREIVFALLAAVGAVAGWELIVRFVDLLSNRDAGDGRGLPLLHLSEHEPKSAYRRRDGCAGPPDTLEVNTNIRLSTLLRPA